MHHRITLSGVFRLLSFAYKLSCYHGQMTPIFDTALYFYHKTDYNQFSFFELKGKSLFMAVAYLCFCKLLQNDIRLKADRRHLC